MTFTPLHLELLAMIERGAAWNGPGFADTYRDLSDLQLTNKEDGSSCSLTQKGQDTLLLLLGYANNNCARAYPTGFPPAKTPIDWNSPQIRESFRKPAKFEEAQQDPPDDIALLREIRDLLKGILAKPDRPHSGGGLV